MNDRFDLHFFKVRSNLLGSKLTVTDRRNREILYVPIKDIGQSSEVVIFADKRSKNLVLRIVPVFAEVKGWFKKIKSALAGPTHFDVIDTEAGEKVGSVRMEMNTSDPQNQKWLFLDAADHEIGHIEPDSTGFLGGKFEHGGFANGQPVCVLKSQNMITGREVNVDLFLDEHFVVDRRLILAIAVKMTVDIVGTTGGE